MMRRSMRLTGKGVKSGDGQLHIDELEILAEAVDGHARVDLREERHRGTEDGIEKRVMEVLAGPGNHGNHHLPNKT